MPPRRVKDATVELLAMNLFVDEALYGGSWCEVAESTRNIYREIAAGKRDLPNNKRHVRKQAYTEDGL